MILREDVEGGVAFGDDGPDTAFGQFRDPEVDAVASALNDQRRRALAAAAA
jgi:hypothetical protein